MKLTNRIGFPSNGLNGVFRQNWPNILGLILVGAFFFVFWQATPVHADPPPGIQEYYVLGYEHQFYRMYKHGGVSDSSLPAFGTGNGYMASIVDVTVTADDQIIFYDHWEDGYETDIFNPGIIDAITGTLILGDGNSNNGDAADYVVGYNQAERGADRIKAGDSLPFSSRNAYDVTSSSPITGYIAIDPRSAGDFRFDGRDRIVSVGGPIGLVHAVWPVRKDTDTTFTNQTWIGDSWEIYSTKALEDGNKYTSPIGEDLSGNQFANVDLQVQAFEDNTTITVDNGADDPISFQLNQGETYFSGDGNGYINDTADATLDIDIRTGATIVADKQFQAGMVAYHYNAYGFQDRYYNMLPENLWDKYYLMPTGDNPVGTGETSDGNSQIYIYNPNTFTITVTSADTGGTNADFDIGPTSVRSYQDATGAANLRDTIPTLSGVSLSSDAGFWAIHMADADPGDGVVYDWGNTFIPLFFLSDEYYASWAPGNVLLPPTGSGNGSPLWVTAVEDETRINVDYDNNGAVDESFLLDALEVVMLRDDTDNDQSGAHIWTENGQKIALIWGEDADLAGVSSPYLDVGHLVLPIVQEWIDPVYSFEKKASPEIVPATGGTVLFDLKATASSFANVDNLVMTDTLPISWTYLSGSTVISYPGGSVGYFDPAISTVTSTLAGGQIGTHTVLFWDLSTSLAPEQAVELQFLATLSNTKGSIGSRHFDDFETDTYTGGTGHWPGNWIDSKADGPDAGDIRIVSAENNVTPYSGNQQLRIRKDNDNIYREVNLSDFARPILRFKRHFYDLEDNEVFKTEISVDNGATYTPVITWTEGSVVEDTWLQEEIDLSSFITDTVRIRFRGISDVDKDDRLYLDDIEIYDDFIVSVNRATARGKYLGYDYVAQAGQNIYLNPFKLVKQASNQSFTLGATATFTMTYSNGSDVITGADFVIQDTLPPGLIFVDASNSGQYITQTNMVNWTIGDILTNTQGSVVLTATVVDTIRPEDGEILENAANLINDEYFIRSNVVWMTALAPDLQVTKNGPGSAHQGDTITYTIQYENSGSIPAVNIIITDAIPGSTTYVPGSCTGTVSCGYITASNTLTWNVGSVGVNASGALTFNVVISPDVPLGTNIQNVALVKHDALKDPDQVTVNTRVSEVKLDKTTSASLVGPGQILTFTLTYNTVTNTIAFISDAIPDNTTYVAGSATGQSGVITPSYSTDGINYQAAEPSPASSVTHLRWAADLISGTTEAIDFQVQVDNNLANSVTIENQASLTATGISQLLSNQVFIPTVKLSLDKRGPGIVEQGEIFTYTLSFGNSGNGAATVILSDTLSVSTTFISATPNPTSTNPLIWGITIPANTNNVEYTVVVSVPGDIPLGTELRNEASLISNQQIVTATDFLLTYIARPFVTIVPNNTGSGHQGGSACYSHIVFNNGAVTDTINLTPTHSTWSNANVTLYKDVNGNGTYQPGTDTLLVDTNSDIVTDTGSISPDSFVHILACLTFPENVEDGSSNVTTIRATSTVSDTNFSESTDTTTVLVGPGLSIAKNQATVTGGPIYPGNEITYTITITNLDNPAGATYFTHTNLIITDIVGSGFSFMPDSGAVEPAGGGIIVTASALTATYPALGLNQTINITLRAKVSTTAGGSVTNVAYVDSDQQGIPANASAVGTVESGLTSQKLATDLNGSPLLLSDTIRYTILVTNTNAALTQNNVTIYDALPTAVTFVTGSETIIPAGNIAYLAGPRAVSATISSLGPQQVVTVTFDVTINSDAAGQSITNTAVISSNEQVDPPGPPEVCPNGAPPDENGTCSVVSAATATLTLTKTAEDVNGPPLVVSDTIRYTLSVTNTGSYTAFNVIVTDTLPLSVTLVSSSADKVDSSITFTAPNLLVWSVDDIAVGAGANLFITVTLNTDTAGQSITNTGTVTGNNISQPPEPPVICPDGSPPDGDGDCSVTPIPATTLTIGKSAEDVNGSPLMVGDEILYTLQVTNTGSYTAYNVTVTDDLPNQVTCSAVAGDNAPGCADPLVWVIPSLAPTNTVATLYITVTGDTGTEGQTITNTGSVTGSNVTTPPNPPDPVCPDGSTEPCEPVVPATTLTIGKSAEDVNGSPLMVGDEILYTLQVTNTGSYTAYNVTVTDDLPNQITCQTVSGDNAPGCADPLVWVIPSLAPTNTVATLYITVTVNVGTEGESITNTGSVTSSNVTTAPDPPDPVCPDGSTGPCEPVVPSTTLTIGKSAEDVNGSPLMVGDEIVYTLQVTNTGSYTAFNVTVTDDLPGEATYQDAVTDWGTPAGTDPVIWAITTLPTSTVATLYITVTVDAGTEGESITNTGSVTSSNVTTPPDPPDPVCPDGSTEPCEPVVPTANLTISKSAEDVNGSPLMMGDKILYTLQVTNTGSYTAYNVTMTDDLPNQVTCSAVSGDNAPGCADPLVWVIPTLAPTNTMATLYITVTVNVGTEGESITNTVSVTSSNVPNPPDPPDPVCPDGSVEPCEPVVPTANLTISKNAEDVNGSPLMVGDEILYTLQVTNTGSYTAYNVTVTDDLPNQITCQTVAGDNAPGCADPLVWVIPSLAPTNTVATLYITVTVDTGTEGETITNTATVTGSNVPNPPDPPVACPDGSPPDLNGNCSTTPLPEVRFSGSSYTVNEAVGTTTITVTLSAASALTTTVEYSTGNGTAIAGSDYVTATGVLIFAPYETSKTFEVNITDDSTPNEGNETVNLSLSNPVSATLGVSGAATLTIEDNDFTLTRHITGSGSIGLNPDQVTYTYGEVVMLTATPDLGWTFIGWSGDLLGSATPITLTMTENKTITATFAQAEYTLAITTVGSGWVLTDPIKSAYAYGEVVTLTAFANFGRTFTGWSGDLSGLAITKTLTMTGNKAITATFTQNVYTLTVIMVGSGSVVTTPIKTTYIYSEVVTLTATASAGWTFTGWTGDLAGSDNPKALTMTGNKTVTATFIQNQYTLTVTAVGGGSVVTTPAKTTYTYGEVVTLTATADPGWTFTGWSGNLTGSTTPVTLTMTGNKAVTATFTQDQYTLTVTTVGNGSVATAPSKATYSPGEVVTLTATADPGWTFTGWSGDLTGSAIPVTLTMNSDKALTATFSQDQYTLMITTVGSGSVATMPVKITYTYGEVVTLTAMADPGWTFTSWSGDLTGSATPVIITMDGNKTVTATFTMAVTTTTLDFSKSALDVNGAPLLVTDTIRYTLQVTNTGSANTAFNVMVTDTLPVSMTLVSTSTSQGVASGSSQIIWDVGNLSPNGGTATMIITVTLQTDTSGQYILNTASADAGNAAGQSVEVCPDNTPPSGGVCTPLLLPESSGGIYLPVILLNSG